MKKFLFAMLIMVLVLLPFAAFAGVEDAWYEISAENTVLTVRLPGNTKTGLEWSYEISDSFALELITQETSVGQSEGMAGAPTSFVASFMSTAGAENTVSLILRCKAPEDDAAAYTRVLEIATTADNKLSVNSVLEMEPFADWCEYSNEGTVLTARLPLGEWDFSITDPAVLELLTCENSEGGFVASFRAIGAGNAEIVFSTKDNMYFRSVSVSADANGVMSVDWVETFQVLQAPKLAQCDICMGWYEEGNIFRNHICSPQPAAVTGGSFKTVNVTASSLNVRAEANTSSEVVVVLKNGTNARYLDETKTDASNMEWHKISYDGKTGWVAAKYAKLGGSGYVKITNGNVNVRTEPEVGSKILAVMSKGSIITYLGEGYTDANGTDWYKVGNAGNEGWVSSKYATFVASAKQSDNSGYKYVLIDDGRCNMRKSPNLDASSVAILKEGTVAKYLNEKSTDNRGVEWYKVSFEGKTGWVSSKYAKLSKSAPEAPKPSTPSTPSTEIDDMRLVLNPNRYDVLRVSDIFSQNGRDIFVTGCFGTINSAGQLEYFDDRKTVTMQLVYGAEVLMPTDLDNTVESIEYIESPEVWFNNARNYFGGTFSFYATFSMNEGGELRNLVYREVL